MTCYTKTEINKDSPTTSVNKEFTIRAACNNLVLIRVMGKLNCLYLYKYMDAEIKWLIYGM